MSDALELLIPDEASQLQVGAALATVHSPGLIVFLEGDLGAGKTTLVRGLLRALGHTGAVRSPTFTLVEPYELDGICLQHLDLYRLADPEELEYLGLRDWLGRDSLLIEWPERGAGFLPDPDWRIVLAHDPGGRRLRLHAGTEKGRKCLEKLATDPLENFRE